ncbi:hypothetical protein ACHAXT_010682 [Thalassiosira profunda]
MASIQGGALPFQRPQRASARCSICAAAFEVAGISPHHDGAPSSSPNRRGVTSLPRIGGLDASFVNIPHSHYVPSVAGTSGVERNMHGIESILDDALRENNGGRREFVHGADMREASQKMDAYLEAAMAMLSSSGEDGAVEANKRSLYCKPCLDRIGTAIETCSERLDEECTSYEQAAAAEEERTSLLAKVVSMNSDADGVSLDDDDEAAIYRAIESFQYELDTLQNACEEQENELRTLQNLMQGQADRSKAISDQEDLVFHGLNALEIDARNFGEESHLVGHSCSAVEDEIDAMSRVKILSLPFDINVDWDDGNGPKAGRYPTINNLRLAYRVNERAGLRREEINAAFSHAAQLVAFGLGLYPDLVTSTVRIIPLRPCAKMLVNLPEGQSVHNLGFDTSSGAEPANHVPSRSITLFLVLLSELSAYILTETEPNTEWAPPPFGMAECSIDGVDVTKLADSNTAAWSSVVYCIAANLRWLSELGIGQSCV